MWLSEPSSRSKRRLAAAQTRRRLAASRPASVFPGLKSCFESALRGTCLRSLPGLLFLARPRVYFQLLLFPKLQGPHKAGQAPLLLPPWGTAGPSPACAVHLWAGVGSGFGSRCAGRPVPAAGGGVGQSAGFPPSWGTALTSLVTPGSFIISFSIIAQPGPPRTTLIAYNYSWWFIYSL